MKIGQKLTLGYLLVALLAGVITFTALRAYDNIDAAFVRLMHEPVPTIKQLEELRSAGFNIISSTNEIGFILSQGARSDHEVVTEEEKQLTQDGYQNYQRSFERYNDLVNVSEEPAVKLRVDIEKAGTELSAMSKEIIVMTKKREPAEEIIEKKEEFEILERAYLAAVDRALLYEYEQLSKEQGNVHSTILSSSRTTYIITFLIFILAISSGLYISRSIAGRLIKLKRASELVGAGDLETHIEIKSHDEIGSLASSFNNMVGDLRESRHEIASAKVFTDQVMDSMVDFVVVLNMDMTIARVNQAGLDLGGYTDEEVIGYSVNMLIGDRFFSHRAVDSLRKSGPVSDLEKFMQMKSGDMMPISVSVSILKNDRGEEIGIVCVGKDMTARKQAEKALRASENRFRSVVESANDAIILMDHTGHIVSWNQSARNIFGYTKREITGKPISTLFPASYLRGQLAGESNYLITSGLLHADSKVTEQTGMKKDGSEFPLEISLSSWANIDGIFYSGIIRDITERKSLEDQLTHQALHDPLTKLANRVLFRDRVKHALERVDRNRIPLGVLFLDLDDFKIINDTMGHAAGDELLISVAQRLQACLRPGDTAARLGGDEYAILIEDTTNLEGGPLIAERIRDILRTPFILGDQEVFISGSIGIVTTVDGSEDPGELLRNADVAMYMAKSKGKDRYAVFERHMRDMLIMRVQLEADMRNAIVKKEFEVFYQPIIDLRSEQIIGMEALARWNHPERGMISPFEFIPVAEEANLIIPLGKWILEEACRQARKWQTDSGYGDRLSVSVNITARQFQDEGLLSTVEGAIAEAKLLPESLILEITESTMLTNTEATLRKFTALKKLGVRLALDDFGTGYSSLSYLQRFPIDILKIDKSFIDRIDHDKEGAAVTRAIITMSDTLHLKTIAEGIENPEQRTKLQNLGCEMGQGFHFAKPLRKEEMSELLKRSLFHKPQDWEMVPQTNGKKDVSVNR